MEPELASKILRTVPQNNAFYFFTDIGQYDGKFAVNLADFSQKVATIKVESVDFHFKRRDFEQWIRETLGDADLADEVNKISKTIQGEELRAKICQIVKRRLTELKKLLASRGSHLRRTCE